MSFQYPKRRRDYVPTEADDWYISNMERLDTEAKQAFLAHSNKVLDDLRVKYREALSDSARKAIAETGVRLRDQRTRHLGAPLDLTSTVACFICKRHHETLS